MEVLSVKKYTKSGDFVGTIECCFTFSEDILEDHSQLPELQKSLGKLIGEELILQIRQRLSGV